MLTVRQRQHAVSVWAMRLWVLPVVPSSGGCRVPSVFGCVAVATAIARLSPGVGGEERGCWLMMLGLGCGEIDAHVHARGVCRGGGGETSVLHLLAVDVEVWTGHGIWYATYLLQRPLACTCGTVQQKCV
jgi:hypothetical protein